jgi:sugar lactone lactonase YvrE
LKPNRIILLVALLSTFFAKPLSAQTVYTVAGDGTAAYGGDGGISTLSKVNAPNGIAIDAAGNIYIADHDNNRIRKISTTGTISTIAGTGFGGYLASQDGGPATAAWIKWPIGIAVDASGNVFFSDYGNNIIRKISTSGIITTIGGIAGSIPSYGGDGGPATAANLGNAWGVAVDAAGNVLVADALNHRVRKINTTTGIISTIAGMGFVGFAGDGGAATAAACRLNEPTGVAVDGAGNIYIADNANNRVRKINTAGIISTIAGVGLPYGYAGDGGPATVARLYYPKAIAVDNPGNVYVCDWNNSVIRKINTSGTITTLAGTGVSGYSGDGSAAISAQLDHPLGLAVRSDGDVFVGDAANNRVRRIKVGNEPYFSRGGSAKLTVCPGEFAYIDSVLKVDDIDVGQTLTWSPVMLPSHATLVVTCTATSTGSTVTPFGATYAPFVGYAGTDTFSVRVTDGIYSDTISIYVTILPFPAAGTISGPDSVCPGYTISLSSTVSGGVWSSSASSVATVSATGVVSGIVAGTAIISYTYTNFCGSASATRTVKVLATVPCITAVGTTTREAVIPISIQPNPGNGNFNVLFDVPSIAGEKVIATVYDIVGSKVAEYTLVSGTRSEILLDVPTGIYLFNVNVGGRNYVEKIIVGK